jgi:hypothetical protein
LACAVAVSASAGFDAASADDLVVESWVGGSSPQEREWALSVRASLAREKGFLASPEDIIKALGVRLPLPPISAAKDPLEGDTMARFSAARTSFNEAVAQYRQGRFQSAERLLTALVAEAQQSPLIFATEVARPVVRQAMLYLVLCRLRLRQTAAANAIAEEFVRSFPGEAEQVFIDFGPLADKLYRSAEARLAALGRGTLLVEVSSRDAVVSVNEGLGANRAFEGSVLPGTYRVLVRTSESGARRYEVPVRPNETVRLSIDWQLDRALSLTKESASLVFDSDRARGSEGSVAVSLAQVLGAGPRVIVLGSRIYNGYRAVSASLYDVGSGRHLGTALAVMDGRRTDAKLASLTVYVATAGTKVGTEIIASKLPLDTVASLAPTAPAAKAPPSRWPAYVAAGAAVAAFGAGVSMMELDGRGTCGLPAGTACPQRYDTAPYAYGLFGASVGFASYAVYRLMRAQQGSSRAASSQPFLGAALAPGGATAWVEWGF